VYCSSGAGGQHVNKTESVVRITHIPTNIVVACQTGRSQHQNRDNAMKMLAAKLYELEIQRNAEKDAVEATKSDIGWGSQIRNYVLDQSRIKDLHRHRAFGYAKVLDGDLDEFVEASLKAALGRGLQARRCLIDAPARGDRHPRAQRRGWLNRFRRAEPCSAAFGERGWSSGSTPGYGGAMMRSESERKELGGFKACRARVDPATLGLPAAGVPRA
jgi:hypothetical protein